MSIGAIIALICWGSFIALLAFGVSCDIRAWLQERRGGYIDWYAREREMLKR